MKPLVCIIILFEFFTLPLSAQNLKFNFTETKMGSPFNLIFVASDSIKAKVIAQDCFNLIDSLSQIFSDYDTSSEISKINANAGLSLHKMTPAMFNLVLLSQEAYRKSHGTYDISIGPLSLLWRTARKKKAFPTESAVNAARKLVGFNQIQINKLSKTIYLPKKGMRLDFGGIAKGYIAQWVIDELKNRGVTEALADAGGDIVMSNAPTNSKGWIVGVNIPETTEDLLSKKLQLSNISVATSGDVYQFIIKNGVKYSHIINPKTGYGVTSLRNVTVIAPTGSTADWLATACSILPMALAKEVAQENHAQLLITTLQKGKIKYYNAASFNKYWTPFNIINQ